MDADHRAFCDRRMSQQDILHLSARYVVAGGDDHIVGAALKPVVAIRIPNVSIAGDVPTILNVKALVLFIIQVATARGTADRKSSYSAGRHIVALLIYHA